MTTPPLCADPSFSCVGTNLGTNGCGESCGTGTKPATNGTWTYSAWSSCSGGTQTRTVTGLCHASCGGTCGPQVLSQSCGCTPSCTGAPASAICSGYAIGGGDDGCGGTCPTVNGTSPYTCASGMCLCTPPEASGCCPANGATMLCDSCPPQGGGPNLCSPMVDQCY